MINKSFYAKLGAAIRAARTNAGKSQTDIAALAGVSFQQVGKWEAGFNRVPLDVLIQISEATGKSLPEIIDVEAIDKPVQTRKHLSAMRVLADFNDAQLSAFHKFAEAITLTN